MKRQKSASYSTDWLRRNSEKEYGLPYEEAIEMSYDNLRVVYDQLAAKVHKLEADRDRLLLACKASYKLPRPWMVAGNVSWPEWDEVWVQLERAIDGRI